jgi:hypothetical protein
MSEGTDEVLRKSKLELNGLYTKADYDKLWRQKFREGAPAQIPNADRQWCSPLGGIARPANQGAKR